MTEPTPSPSVVVTHSEVAESVRRTDCASVTLSEAQYREAERLLASALYALISDNLPRLIGNAQTQAAEFPETDPEPIAPRTAVCDCCGRRRPQSMVHTFEDTHDDGTSFMSACEDCIVDAPPTIDPETLQEVLDGYQACATWCAVPLSASDSDESFDDLGVGDWDAAAEAECRADCEAFIRDNLAALLRVTDATDYTWERVGHDLWLSRNGHGSGFFDRVGPAHKHRDDFDALQEAASAWGEVNLDLTEPDAEGEQRIVIA